MYTRAGVGLFLQIAPAQPGMQNFAILQLEDMASVLHLYKFSVIRIVF